MTIDKLDQGFMYTGFISTGFHVYRVSYLQGFMSTGFHVYRVSCLQGFMSAFLLLKLDLHYLGKKQKKKIRNVFVLIKKYIFYSSCNEKIGNGKINEMRCHEKKTDCTF